MTPRVCLVAAPLTARSGVYRSSRELVEEARAAGLDWSLVLGVSGSAAGTAPTDDPPYIREATMEPAGVAGVARLARTLLAEPLVAGSDIVVSLIPQSDMALALTGLRWVAYLRGMPWPEKGESGLARRLVWRTLERAALARAGDVWATTEMLRAGVSLRRSPRLVPPGIRLVERQWDGRGARSSAVWAARFDRDKNPQLFLDVLRPLPVQGKMFGSGPLAAEVRAAASPNVVVPGWTDPEDLWRDAFVYLGTSHREAFGRSAVEAAMAGIPVVLSDSFGAASLLIRDPGLRERFVLPVGDPRRWRNAVEALAADESLRVELSQHVFSNAQELSVSVSVAAMQQSLAALPSAGRRGRL